MTKEVELSGHGPGDISTDTDSAASWTLGLTTALIMSGLALSLALKPIVSAASHASATDSAIISSDPKLASP